LNRDDDENLQKKKNKEKIKNKYFENLTTIFLPNTGKFLEKDLIMIRKEVW
jgi:hypothetical protein